MTVLREIIYKYIYIGKSSCGGVTNFTESYSSLPLCRASAKISSKLGKASALKLSNSLFYKIYISVKILLVYNSTESD